MGTEADSFQKELEKFKAGVAYMKHLTTLSTGSIVLIAAFLEKVFTKPLWRVAVVVSLIGFVISVLSSTVAYTLGLIHSFPGDNEDIPEWSETAGSLGIRFAWIGFLIGIISLATFFVKNFIQ
jgi:hypothetical protein